MSAEHVAENLQVIRQRFAQALKHSARAPDAAQLMVVSKTFSAEVVQAAVDAGQTLFGENRVQELLAKQPLLPAQLQWHLIGHLQSNKVRKVLPAVEAVHGVDRIELARDMERIAAELGLYPQFYLEVNIGGESTKFGFKAEQLLEQMEELLSFKHLELQGLMCIPPWSEKAEDARRYFVALRELRDDLERRFSCQLPGLSMGMSQDFEVALEEGSTLVRVGSAVFGKRL